MSAHVMQFCASVCGQPWWNHLHSTQRETPQQAEEKLRGTILDCEWPCQWCQQPKWDSRGEEEQKDWNKFTVTRWGMDVPKMKWWSSLFSAKMKYDSEGAQCHFLPGTGSAHLELSAVCPLLLLHGVVMALVTAVAGLSAVIMSKAPRRSAEGDVGEKLHS